MRNWEKKESAQVWGPAITNLRWLSGVKHWRPGELARAANGFLSLFSHLLLQQLHHPLPSNTRTTWVNECSPVALTSVVMKFFHLSTLCWINSKPSSTLCSTPCSLPPESTGVGTAVSMALRFIFNHDGSYGTLYGILFVHVSACNTIFLCIRTISPSWVCLTPAADGMAVADMPRKTASFLFHSSPCTLTAPTIISMLSYWSLHMTPPITGIINRREVVYWVAWWGQNNFELNCVKTEEMVVVTRNFKWKETFCSRWRSLTNVYTAIN